MSGAAPRYSAVAIVLHWAIAAAILFNIPLGFWMHVTAEDGSFSAAVFEAFQLHKSVGLTVLALSLVRLGWRLTHKPPPLPEHMPRWERFIAKATHWAFYALMIGLPLSGWLYVSSGWSHEQGRAFNVPTVFFGLFPVPHLFGIAEGSPELRSDLADATFTAHYVLAYAAIALAVAHVGAALKHHFIDGDEVLAHMVPGVRGRNETASQPRNAARAALLGAGLAAVLVGVIGLGYAAATLGRSETAAEPLPNAPVVAEAPLEAPMAADGASQESIAAPDPAIPGAPALWRVDQSASAIRFSGVHADQPFQGTFSRWRAEIRFDPNNLDASSAVVTMETGSAADGIAVHDSSLPAAEWFDVANHPTAVFRSERIRARGGNEYEARGTLTLKGRALDIDLPFTLRIDGDRAVMDGRAEIDRREADLGMESDPDAEWVSREIRVDVHVEAVRAQ